MGQTPDMKAMSEQAHAAQVEFAGKSIGKLVEEAGFTPGTAQEVLIRVRASEMPRSCVRAYLRAMRGRASTTAIRAMCCMCMGWDDYRVGIEACTDPACPLYPYRPYQV